MYDDDFISRSFVESSSKKKQSFDSSSIQPSPNKLNRHLRSATDSDTDFTLAVLEQEWQLNEQNGDLGELEYTQVLSKLS